MSAKLTLVTVVAMLCVMIFTTASSADACGYHKVSQCYPSTPVPTTVPVPTAAPAPVIAPVVIPVTPVSTPVVQLVAPQATQQPSQNLIGVKVEVCHFEPTTQQWEIRHHEQAGDRAVIEHGLCAQDRASSPTPVPVVVVTTESAPEAPVSTPSIELVDVPAMPEIVPSEPVVTPEVPPDVEIVPEPAPDEPSGVPVQIP